MDESHKQTQHVEQPEWIEHLQDARGLRAELCRRLLKWLDDTIPDVRLEQDCAEIRFRYSEVMTDEDRDGADVDYLEVIVEDHRHESIDGAL